MDISNKLTQQKLQEILVDSYIKGQEIENIQLIEFIEDIKQKVLLVIYSSND